MLWQYVPDQLSSELLSSIDTPSIIYVEKELDALLEVVLEARQRTGFKLLYAVKACTLSGILERIAPYVDGFAVSSLFEARLARRLHPGCEIHLTTPAIRASDVEELATLCDFVSFNSASQAERYHESFRDSCSVGMRINTRVSKVPDARYDPCYSRSKLGFPIEIATESLFAGNPCFEGIHIHTNADSTDFAELVENVLVLLEGLPAQMQFKWVNLGGGYLFQDSELDLLLHAVDLARARFGAEVYVEPGAGLVRSAGFLVCSVLDLFEVDGAQIAVLDTSVNHMPEVLEFQYQPEVAGHDDLGQFEYTLAGSTCLAGDSFGIYRFQEPLDVGSRVVIEEAGAYSLVKAHRFNGLNLPSVGYLNSRGEFTAIKKYMYSNFEDFWMTNDDKP